MMANSSTFRIDNATLALFKDHNTGIAISVIYIFISLLNLVGNGLSLWILLFRTSPKTPSIIFMLHLTLTDLALGTALPFQMVYQLKGYHWNLGPNMCSFLTMVFYTNMYCSILTVMAIGIDRYLGIVRPMLFRQTRERKSVAVFSCILMWVVVLAVLYPLMTTDLTFDIPELGITTCFDMLKKDMLPNKAAWALFVFAMVFVLFFFPFCVTVFCYIRVICKLASDRKTRQKKRAIYLAVVVILVYTLCFAPNNILLLAHGITKLFYGRSLYMAYKLSLCLSCMNSCLDPFIYYFASKDFRQKLRRILKLQSQSSAESTRNEHKESIYSAHCNFTEGQDKEPSKVSLMPQCTSK
ncbi:P2Y purinoceptor 8 [Notolabrus celidotus]|uniref:P2Y purinoceptor 8 n=1 Tax=Notolabrus celidotus TaxID=1203425 RepID=UPI0014904464|nr:P2Y purinoceptor 8 [Notolabrus celidotus]